MQKLEAFFIKNYSDLLSEYQDKYELSEKYQKILVEFIIKYESNYFKANIKEKSDIDLKPNPKKKMLKFEMWYCKFILTQPELFNSLLIDINDDYKKENYNNDEDEEEDYKNIYTPKIRLTLLRLYLILKYNFDDTSNNLEYISLFNEKLGKNYLINHKDEIFKTFKSIEDDFFVQLCKALLENLESLFIFQDENEINDKINTKRISWNIIVLQKISIETKVISEGELFWSYKKMEESIIFRKEIEEKNINYIIKLISELKNQNTSLIKIFESNLLFLKNIYYLIIKCYYSFFRGFKGEKNFSQNKIDVIYGEIKDFIIFSNDYGPYDIYLKEIFTIFDSYVASRSKKLFSSQMDLIYRHILNIRSNIDFSIIEKYINKCIFYWFYFIIDFKFEDEYENFYYLGFHSVSKVIFDMFFNEFLQFFNPDLSQKYKPIEPIFDEFFDAYKGDNCWRISFSKKLFNESVYGSYIFNREIFYYIFLKKSFPNYNPILALYHYRQKFNGNGGYFSFIDRIISEGLNNKYKVEKQLFLLKEEDIPSYLGEKIQFIYKTKKTRDFIINKLLIIFMNKYLIDFSYEGNFFESLVKDFFEKFWKSDDRGEFDISGNEDDLNLYRSIIFNFPFSGDSCFDNGDLISAFLKKLISKRKTFYEFLKKEFIEDIDNEKKMRIRIKILEKVFEFFSDEKEPNDMYMRGQFESKWDNIKGNDWFFGLYTFLNVLKKENKNLLDLGNNHYIFLKDTLFTFFHFRNVLLNRNNYKKDSNELNKKVEFVLKEIHEVLYNILSYEDFLKKIEVDEDEEDKISLCDKKLRKIISELIYYYNQQLYDQMNNIKNTKFEFNFNFEQFKNILTNILSIGYIQTKININKFKNTLVYLFENNIDNFFSLLTTIYEFFGRFYDYSKNLLPLLLKKNIKKFFENFEEIKSIINCKEDWYKNPFSERNENDLKIFILNNSDISFYSKLGIINDIPPLKDSYKLLRKIKNKESSLFILKKIQSNNKNTNIEILFDLLENTIYNEHIYNYLFESILEKEVGELTKNNKYLNIIIIALFKFSEINCYLIIQKLLSLISKYNPNLDLKSLILPPVKEPYDNMVNLEELDPYCFTFEKEEKKEQEKYKKLRYLLFYALSNRIARNYETISVLFEYCPLNEGIQFFINEITGNNFDNLFKCKIKYLEYFLKEFNKNKNVIKEFGGKFYSFLLFMESILKNREYISKLNDQEKYIYINYIKIFLLEVIPKELEIFEEDDTKDKNSKNSLLYNSQNKLMILLSLYQLKGNPILNIKSHYPIFYSKIEKFLNKYKSLDIKLFSIKTDSDVNKFNKIKNNILTENNLFIWRSSFQIFPEFMNLIKVKKRLDSEEKEIYELFYEYSIEILFLNLLRNKNIKPVYNNSLEENQTFFSALYDDKNEIEVRYKPIIDSLLDFNKSSIYVMQNQNEIDNAPFIWRENNEKDISLYIAYLKFVNDLCSHVISKCDNNKDYYQPNIYLENLGNQEKNKLIEIKNTINIDQIFFEIFKQLKKSNPEDEMKEFYNSLKQWPNNYLKKSETMKEYKKLYNENNNLLSYFKYLKLSCYIILHFIEIIERCTEIYNENREFIWRERIDHKIYYTYEKKIPKEETIKAFQEIGNEVFDYIKDIYIDFDEINRKDKMFKTYIPLYFYFNEEKEIFVEVFADNYPYDLTREKFIYDFLFDFFNYFGPKNFFESYENKLKNRLKDNFCNRLIEIIETKDIQIDEKNLSFYKEIFEPFYKKYYHYLKSFFNNNLEVKIYPSFADFESDIKNQFKEYFYFYLYPSYIFNRNLYIFANNENNYFPILQKDCYNKYANFDELIKSIDETKYHQNEKLNFLFKRRAINYIINDNSNINYFIQELFSIIYNKKNKTKKLIVRRKKNIEYHFNIKIEFGNKFDLDFAKKILKRKNIYKNNFIEHNLSKSFVKNKSKIYYSIICFNPFKRKLIPSTNYKGFVPFRKLSSGTNMENVLSHAFYNYTIIKDKNLLLNGIDKSKNGKHKNENKKENELINVFELMFSIKSVSDNLIVLKKNDISKILKIYSNNENSFMKLINHRFSERENENVLINWDNITFNWKYDNNN